MWALLGKMLQWLAVGGIPAFMVHAGLSVAVFTGMELLINQGLGYVVSSFQNVATAALQIALLAGVGTFINIIGSALLTRVAISAAMKSMGIIRT